MPVKKNKLLFRKEKSFGNILELHLVYGLYEGNELIFGEIRIFKKGEYLLPKNWFGRDDKGLPIKTKSLQTAKKKCKLWFDEFIKYYSK